MTDITIIDKFRNHARQVEVFYEFCQKNLEGITILYAKDFVRLIHLFVNQSPMTDLNNKLLGIAKTLDDIGYFRPFLLESMFNKPVRNSPTTAKLSDGMKTLNLDQNRVLW